MTEELGSRIWHARKGDYIVEMTWAEMTPVHLRNVAAFLRRKHQENIALGYRVYSMVQGEMAEHQIECQLQQLEDDTEDLEAYANEMERYADYKDGHVNYLKKVFGHG